MINHIESTQQFNELTKDGLCLVDFFATWCGPCKMLAPLLEEVSEDGSVPGLKVLKVDVDVCGELAQAFQIQAVPTLFLMKDGKVVGTKMGYMNKNTLVSFCLNN